VSGQGDMTYVTLLACICAFKYTSFTGRIPYRVEKVNMRCYGDKPASFMRLNPSGGIPVANIRSVDRRKVTRVEQLF
jgi:glutathione S-transferase